MLKVFFDHSIFLHQQNGGISKYICRLYEGLIKSKYKIKAEIFSPITINDNLINIKKNNKSYFFKIKKIPKYCTKIFYLFNNILSLIYLKIYKPDLIHLTYFNYFLIRFTNIPYILTVHDLIHEKFFKESVKRNKIKLINNAAKIICISNETKKDLINYYKTDNKKIAVIHHGVQKKKIKNNKKKNFILFVGERRKYKNFDKLISAFYSSFFLKKNFKIICFGGGNFSQKEKINFQKLDIEKKVIFVTGNEKKINQYYLRSKILVYPSQCEGFGLPIIEALSFKCPVLVNDINIFREILDNPIFYYKRNSFVSLKKKLEKILKSKNKQKKNFEMGFRRLDHFQLKNSILNHAKIYKSFLK